MRRAKTLIRLGGCPGWSESSQGAQSLSWFCHVATPIIILCMFMCIKSHLFILLGHWSCHQCENKYTFAFIRVCDRLLHARYVANLNYSRHIIKRESIKRSVLFWRTRNYFCYYFKNKRPNRYVLLQHINVHWCILNMLKVNLLNNIYI